MRHMSSRLSPPARRLAPYGLILLAFLIRVHGLSFQSLWRDEVDALCFAQAPLLARWPDAALSFTPSCPPNIPDLISAFTQPGFNGPLYFLILRGWISLAGYSEYALRFLSGVCGTLSVAVMISLGTRLFNRGVGLIAGTLLAVSAYQVWYSQETKMYTLITLLALASIYFLRRGVEEPRPPPAPQGCSAKRNDAHPAWRAAQPAAGIRREQSVSRVEGRAVKWKDVRLRWWVGAVVCTSFAMYAHILAALLIPVEVALFLLWWPHSRKHLVAGGVSLLLVTLPYWPLAAQRIDLIFQPAETGFGHFTLPDMISVLGSAYTSGILNPIDPTWLAAIAGLAAALALFGLFSIDTPARSELRRERVLVRLSLAAWAAIPALAIYLISLNRPLFTDRYLIWIQPAFYLAVALGVYALWRWIKPLAVIALLVLVAASAAGVVAQATTSYKSDFRSAAQVIGREINPGDVLAFQIPYVRYTFNYYFRRSYPWLDGLYTNYPGSFDGYRDSRQTVLDQVTQQFQGQRTVWLVASEVEMWDQRDLLRSWLNTHGVITFQADYPRVQITRYELTR